MLPISDSRSSWKVVMTCSVILCIVEMCVLCVCVLYYRDVRVRACLRVRPDPLQKLDKFFYFFSSFLYPAIFCVAAYIIFVERCLVVASCIEIKHHCYSILLYYEELSSD